MKLKLILLDRDQTYLNRIVSALSLKQDYHVEAYAFTDVTSALSSIPVIGAGLFIADASFEVDPGQLPDTCVFAYFTESSNLPDIRGQRVIGKYQRADLILRDILSIYADSHQTGTQPPQQFASGKCSKVIAFFPCGGGSGSSSAAAACALRFTGMGKRAIYLNFEMFGSSEIYFEAEGRLSLGDLIYSVRTNHSNLQAKIRSAVKKDDTGVFFIDSCRAALEAMETTESDVRTLVEAMQMMADYDPIIIDADLRLDGASLAVMKAADAILFVSDGSESSVIKLKKVSKAMEILAEKEEFTFPNSYLLYNKFSRKTGIGTDELDLPLLGGVPRYEGASVRKIARQLAEHTFFDKLISN